MEFQNFLDEMKIRTRTHEQNAIALQKIIRRAEQSGSVPLEELLLALVVTKTMFEDAEKRFQTLAMDIANHHLQSKKPWYRRIFKK
jgi:chemotaxis methyl-accepting protein methylase